MSSFPAPISNATSGYSYYLRYLPLLIPAVKDDGCAVDSDLLLQRIISIAFIAIDLFVACLYSLPASIPSELVVIITGTWLILSLFFDNWLADRAADANATNEYLTKEYPSKKATFRIQTHLSAAKQLARERGDFNKLNEMNEHLLNFYTDLRIFKCFVDHGANIRDHSRVLYLIKSKEFTYLEYVLSKRLVRHQDFTAEQQIEFWLNINSAQKAELLRKHGFDINIRDPQGNTPLLRLVKKASRQTSQPYGSLNHGRLTSILLDNGANPRLTVDENGRQMDAIQLNTNAEIARTFTQKISLHGYEDLIEGDGLR